MRMERRALALVATAALLVVAAPEAPVRADPGDGDRLVHPGSDPVARARAAALFDDAEKAFDRGDYLHAADAFERAYRSAPNVDTLWNAARSWDRGGNLARAATTLARYLRDAPSSAPDRNVAQARLIKLARRLARLEVRAAEGAAIEIDREPREAGDIYVNPGSHIAVAVVEGAREQRNLEVKEGDTVTVTFDAPPTSGPPPPSAIPLITPQRTILAIPDAGADKPHQSGWSPWVFVTGATITAALAGVTVWSGVQTLGTLNAFNAHPTMSNLSNGQSQEIRTNVLLATTLGVAGLTAAAGIWLVGWRGGSSSTPRVALGLGTVRAEWSF